MHILRCLSSSTSPDCVRVSVSVRTKLWGIEDQIYLNIIWLRLLSLCLLICAWESYSGFLCESCQLNFKSVVRSFFVKLPRWLVTGSRFSVVTRKICVAPCFLKCDCSVKEWFERTVAVQIWAFDIVFYLVFFVLPMATIMFPTLTQHEFQEV